MGLFDWLFGRKPVVAGAGEPGAADPPPRSDPRPPVASPTALARAVELQRAYWTHDPEEQARLEARGADGLEWGSGFGSTTCRVCTTPTPRPGS